SGTRGRSTGRAPSRELVLRCLSRPCSPVPRQAGLAYPRGSAMTSAMTKPAHEIRRFHVDVPEDAIADLHRRLDATRWPTMELVRDRSQGVQLATIQELARYWRAEYDWRACEARLNTLPQFVTAIDGVDIHFIHVRSRHESALPL